ncbi:MAG: DsbA family protein [Hyphomicrobiaceae bacterium]|nr:DsbA family protein [Hyphomicrobiaceae bacterium]
MTLKFEVYWSMRSPFCYLALDRILTIRKQYDVEVDLRIVYPLAVRSPDFFKTAPTHYRTYHLRDSNRVAEFLNIPYRRPIPDPVVQDMETHEIAEEQPHIHQLTRLAVAAAQAGKGLEFQDQVMRLLWDGRTNNWHEGNHLANAISRAGLNPDALKKAIEMNRERYDAAIEENHAAQTAAGHGGVPLFVFLGEPFFGQDRIDILMWRMRQSGLAYR